MVIQGTGVDWIIKDIDTGHSPQLVAPDKLCDLLLELGKHFESLWLAEMQIPGYMLDDRSSGICGVEDNTANLVMGLLRKLDIPFNSTCLSELEAMRTLLRVCAKIE